MGDWTWWEYQAVYVPNLSPKKPKIPFLNMKKMKKKVKFIINFI